MLLPEYLFHVSDRVVELWEQLNIFAVRDIARRIIDAGYHMTASADWQIYKMRESGMSYESIQGGVAKLTEKSEAEVKRIFENSIIEGYKEDQKIYDAAGVGGIPFGTDTASKQLQVYYEQTNGELRNFTRTTALQGQRAFIEACDEAFIKVKSGLQSYNQAIEQAVDTAAKEGLYVKYPGGRRDTVEVAVRRAVMTGVNRASIQMTIDTCERQGTNYVKISSHLGARIGKTKAANHAGWQGGIYRIKERDKNFFGDLAHFHDKILVKQYPLLEEETGYPSDPTGLGGYNCRHSASPYIPGIVPDRDDNIDVEKNRKAYEASQEQRRMEREMRTTRRQIEAHKAAKENAKDEELRKLLASAEVKAKNRLNGQFQDYSDFCAKNNIAEQRERLYLAKGDWKKKLEDKGGVSKALSVKPSIEQKIVVAPKIRDITEEFIKNSKPGQGSVTYEAGFNFKNKEAEIENSLWLRDTYGGDIVNLKEQNDRHIPDHNWDGKLWELKTSISNKFGTIDKLIHKGLLQIEPIPGGIILDLRNNETERSELLDMVKRIINDRIKFRTIFIIRLKNECLVWDARN